MGKTREQQKAYIKTIGVNALPDAPSQDGYGPAQIKQAFSEGVEQEMDFRHEYEESNDLNITALQTSLQSLSALVNDIVAGVYVIDKATKDGDGNVITSTYLKIVDLQNGIIGALKYVKSNGELENIHKIASDLETLSLAYNTFVNGYFTGDSAKKALVATKAINDVDGKPIKTTYATIVNLQTLSTNLTQVINGTTVVDKARKDQNGDVISNTYVKLSTRGQANGIATLNASGKVPESQLPDSVISGLKYGGELYICSASKSTTYYLLSSGLLSLSDTFKNAFGITTSSTVTTGGLTRSNVSNGISYRDLQTQLYSKSADLKKLLIGFYFNIRVRYTTNNDLGLNDIGETRFEVGEYSAHYTGSWITDISGGDYIVIKSLVYRTYSGSEKLYFTYSTIDNTSQVRSVNSKNGFVTLTSEDINDGDVTIKQSIKNSKESVIGITAEKFDLWHNYNINDYCVYNDKLYRCISPVTMNPGGSWNPAKWTETSVGAEMASGVPKAKKAENADKLGNHNASEFVRSINGSTPDASGNVTNITTLTNFEIVDEGDEKKLYLNAGGEFDTDSLEVADSGDGKYLYVVID